MVVCLDWDGCDDWGGRVVEAWGGRHGALVRRDGGGGVKSDISR